MVKWGGIDVMVRPIKSPDDYQFEETLVIFDKDGVVKGKPKGHMGENLLMAFGNEKKWVYWKDVHRGRVT